MRCQLVKIVHRDDSVLVMTIVQRRFAILLFEKADEVGRIWNADFGAHLAYGVRAAYQQIASVL